MRLNVLPPLLPGLVQGIIAGGAAALVRELGRFRRPGMETLRSLSANYPTDVVGITAGGTTSLAHSSSATARSDNRYCCVPVEQVSAEADIDIRLWVGRKYWLDLLASKLERPSWR